MTIDLDALERKVLREDLAYHQARVLLLVDAVSREQGHARKLDGLTKLAKLDFLLRYPALAPVILDNLSPSDPRLQLTPEDLAEPTNVEAPMIRYKYGPWDDRYYAVIGALVGRGLLKYARGKKGSVALTTTRAGRDLASEMSRTADWNSISDRSQAIAQASTSMSGSALKDLIYQRLAAMMDRPHRQVIR
ncbi:hypothetical protein AB0C77_01425 [Streptomyces sp. NPDC048629]|uniref:hypothetical protein n=1 Tax=Streptomyces sp. NPDC048629 TaxID=3154824 RepID=UPI00343C299A